MNVTEELAEPVAVEALLALRFAAEKQRLALHAVDAAWVSAVIARRSILAAVRSGELVEHKRHADEVERLKRRADQFSKYWASAKVEADRQLQRVQAALGEIEDRGLAAKLADQIGVILPEAEDSLFEVQP